MSQHRGLTRAAFLKAAAGVAALSSFDLPVLAAAPAMNTRPIPKSKNGEQLPVIGLGTRAMSKNDAKAVAGAADVIRTLIEGGCKVIDTAANYAGGDSEEIIGETLQKGALRSRAFISTKFAERGKDNGIRSIENSLKTLGTDVIDVMYIHNMVDIATHLPTLEEYKARGKFRYIGISDTSQNQDALIPYLDRLDFIEFAYAADSREAESRLLPAARDKGVACLIALPLGRGRALNAVEKKPFPEWAKAELAVETYAQLLLKFVVGHPAVTVAIPSTLNPTHMAENMVAARGPVPTEKQRAQIAAIWS